MNRHPAVVARMASTLQIASGGRLILGIGIGGHPKEHAAYGIDFPAAPERVARLEEAVAVIRALWTGGPVTRPSPFYPLAEAHAHPVPSPAAADRHRRRDGRRARDWPAGSGTAGATFEDNFEANLPLYLEALEANGRRREDQHVYRRVPGRLALGRDARRFALGDRAARDVGSLARGRGRRRHRPGPDDGRRRCPRGGDRTLVGPGPAAVARRSWHHRPVTSPTTTPAPGRLARRPAPGPQAAHARLPPVRRARAARRRPVRALQPARAQGLLRVAGPRHGLHRRARRGHRARAHRPAHARRRRAVRGHAWSAPPPTGRGLADHARGDEPRHGRRPDDVPADRPAGPQRRGLGVPAEPAHRARGVASPSRRPSPSSATRCAT